MDGINNIVPMSDVVEESVPEVPPLCLLFGEKPPKPKGKPPTYVKIMDWKKNKTIKCYRGLCYESSNSKVATVTKNGKIKTVGKGICKIYVYA